MAQSAAAFLNIPEPTSWWGIPAASVIDFNAVRTATLSTTPYPYLFSHDAIWDSRKDDLWRDFPDIPCAGFFPFSEMSIEGGFAALIHDLASDEFAEVLENKLEMKLQDKPRLITVRKWSVAGDGRIHNDSESKIATALVYLNPTWPASGAGCFRVLKSATSLNDYVCEVPPTTGALIAFRRTEKSWHGHLPFVGERRVVQMAYLRSQADYDRKAQRGRVSMLLKKLNPFGKH